MAKRMNPGLAEWHVMNALNQCGGVASAYLIHDVLRGVLTATAVKAAAERLVRKGLVRKSKRDELKHLPWQKVVPVRINVYHVNA